MKTKNFEHLSERSSKVLAERQPVWTLYSVSSSGKRFYEICFEGMKIRFEHFSSVYDFLHSNCFE